MFLWLRANLNSIKISASTQKCPGFNKIAAFVCVNKKINKLWEAKSIKPCQIVSWERQTIITITRLRAFS